MIIGVRDPASHVVVSIDRGLEAGGIEQALLGPANDVEKCPVLRSTTSSLAFSALTNVRPMIETMPLERALEAYDRMMSGEARFRMVLTTGL